MNAVKVTLTRTISGTGLIFPYARDMRASTLSLYEVPLYLMRIEPNITFRVIRFGLTPPEYPPPRQRRCNVGLTSERTVHPTYIHYRTHSFGARGRQAAWKILPGQQFYLHEGAEPNRWGGSLGCVEVIAAKEWDRFLSSLETAAGASCDAIGAARALTLVIEATSYPMAYYSRTVSV